MQVLGESRDSAAERSSHRTAVRQECETFVQGVSGAAGRQPQVVIDEGAPEALLRDYVRDREVDLVVLGTHGRSGLLEVFLGSVARRIMDALPCDALIVRGPAAATKP